MAQRNETHPPISTVKQLAYARNVQSFPQMLVPTWNVCTAALSEKVQKLPRW